MNMTPTFADVMTMIAHLGNRDEAVEQDIVRKNEGDLLLLRLWEYRTNRFELWQKYNRDKYPRIGTKPGFLHLLSEDLSPEDNWKKIWADKDISAWMKHTKPVWDLECKIKKWYASVTMPDDSKESDMPDTSKDFNPEEM